MRGDWIRGERRYGGQDCMHRQAGESLRGYVSMAFAARRLAFTVFIISKKRKRGQLRFLFGLWYESRCAVFHYIPV